MQSVSNEDLKVTVMPEYLTFSCSSKRNMSTLPHNNRLTSIWERNFVMFTLHLFTEVFKMRAFRGCFLMKILYNIYFVRTLLRPEGMLFTENS
jgi:hypothetical protein